MNFLLKSNLLSMKDKYEAAEKHLQELVYLLRIQNRQQEADLVFEALERIRTASGILKL